MYYELTVLIYILCLWLVLGVAKLGKVATGIKPGGTKSKASWLVSGILPPFLARASRLVGFSGILPPFLLPLK